MIWKLGALYIFLSSFLLGDSLQKARELKANGKLSEAIDVLKAESSLEAKKYLAKIYLEIGEMNEALPLYESVCPQVNTHDCFNELAITQASVEKYAEAIQNFQKAIQLEPQSASTYSALAMAYF
ncbi:MAG: tetratricopeptide repeat protein, partial [Leptospiraceae bacterium]|nr:tetratricopeptide repeat protein [Leptospiraceae bacterium]